MRISFFVILASGLCVAGCSSGQAKDDSGFTGFKDAKVQNNDGQKSYDSPPAVPAGTSVVVRPANMDDPKFKQDPKLAAAGGAGH